MDLSNMLYTGTLDDTFPLPRDEPFTRRQALDAGITRNALGRLVDHGLVRRPLKGVYVATDLRDDILLRARCLRLVVPDDCVVVDRHAGWLHGAEMVLAPGEHMALRPLSLYRPSGHGRLRNNLSSSGERDLRPDDIMDVHGLRVSTPIRTAWDLGRVQWQDDAIAGLDAMLRLGRFDRDELVQGVGRFRGMRWVTVLRATAPLADGRSESPGESVLRMRCRDLGIHVVPQVEVTREGRVLARLDLADEASRLGIEYDGDEWHSTPEQIAHDRARRTDLAHDDWTIAALRKDDVFGRARACDDIIRSAAAKARGGRHLWIA